MNKIKNQIILMIFTLIILPFGINNVKAAGNHGLYFTAVLCDNNIYNSDDPYNNYEMCLTDYQSGDMASSYILQDGQEIDPGSLVLFVVNYKLGSAQEVIGINSTITFDSNIWTPGLIDGELYDTNDFIKNKLPARNSNRKSASWQIELNYIPDQSIITYLIYENNQKVPLTENTEIGYFYMKLGENATGNAGVMFSYDDFDMTDANASIFNDRNNLESEVDLTNISFNVAGESISKDNTLGSLSVENGSTSYKLDPTFVSGSKTTVYNTVVPNNVTSVTLNATAHDPEAQIGLLDTSTELLNVGNNKFTITVTAKYGNVEIYTVNVYRLSNDATLSNIAFTNNISVGNMIDNQYTYETTVPYAINTTNVTATPTHSNATVYSGNGTFDLTNSGETLNTREIIVYAEDCNALYNDVEGNQCSHQTYTINISRTAASSNKYLKNLSVDGVAVSGFNKTIYEYDLGNVANSKTTMLINASVDDTGKAKIISGLGTVNLNIGQNSYDIVVRAENGDEQIYKIKAYRLSNDATLKSLTVTSTPQATLSPIFTSSFTGTYNYNYDATVTNYTVSATVNDTSKAYVSISDITGAVAPKTLNSQSQMFGIETTDISVVVTAEDGTIKTYTLKTERAKSDDNTLSSLEITPGTLSPEFRSDEKKYQATVEGDVTSINVNAVPNSMYGTIDTITGNTSLSFGPNQIEVVVRAENGNRSSYFINVTRKKYDISTLDDIKVNDTSVKNFRSDTLEYTLDNVPFETTKLNISTIKSNSYATVDVDGEVSLNTGDNTINIVVTAHNGVDKTTYKLHVYREKNSDNSISNLQVHGNTATLDGENTYSVTLENDITIVNPDDVTFNYSSDATINKTQVLELSTKINNVYTFDVISENNDVASYTINIKRKKSSDASISKVTLTIGDDSSRHCLISDNKCKIEVPVDTLSFSLNAELPNEASISPVNGTNYNMPANESLKDITLTVTAEDGTVEIYTIKVERQKSSNTNLKSITVNGTDISTFNKDTLSYELSYDGDMTEVTVDALVEDTDKAKILTDLSNPFALEFDKRNQVQIVVEAENGDIKTYTLYITRNRRKDVSLSNLTINGIQIDNFESTKDNYTLSDVEYNTHKLNIVAVPTDSNATKTGDGLVSLTTGLNNIVITVTAHDGVTTKDYTINVTRNKNDNKNIDSIVLAGVTAAKTSSTVYEVTVPNSIESVTSSNLLVTVPSGLTSYDKKATVSFDSLDLQTSQVNSLPIKVTAEDDSSLVYTLNITREKSSDASLTTLSVTNGSFSPSFNKDILEYDVIVPVDTTEFSVSAVTNEGHASITSGIGHYNMTESSKKVKVVVVSENEEETLTYVLNISRAKSSENRLSDITVSEGVLSPTFDKDKTSYTVNVEGNVESIDVGATLLDSRATIISGTGTHPLEVGTNTITIRVESESGAPIDYTIDVIRAPKLDNYLTDLLVDGVTVLNFSKDTLEYDLGEVEYDKTSIQITATKSDADAEITGTGNKTLKTGSNSFNIVVTAQNGTTRTYIINISRKKNDNANLSILSVMGYSLDPSFNKDTDYYEVTVNSTKDTLTKDDITAIAEDSNATVTKDDTISLSTTLDNLYKITVAAENGTEKVYTIKVIRPKSSDATLSSVNVVGAGLTPTFNKDKTEYTITVPHGSTSFEIEGIPTVSTTTVTGNDTYLTTTKTVTLNTVAEDGISEKTYVFHVTEAPSNDATLSSLSIDGYPLNKNFQATTLSYSIGNIPNGTTKLKINATANNALATIEYFVSGEKQDSNIVNIPVGLGTKSITVQVTAADGVTQKVYDIEYTVIKSSNYYLRNLIPSISNIDFNKTTYFYEISVNNDVTSINFDVETEDPNATITVNGDVSFTPKTISVDNLIEGNNNLEILVTAEDDTKKTYTVTIKRLKPVVSSDANLSSLSVDGYTFDKAFNMDTLEYSIGNIPFALDKLTINATPNIASSKISYLVNGIKQNSNVVNIPRAEGTGAIIVQTVAEDGTTIKNYKITYSKIASTNAYLSDIVVSVGTLSPIFNKETYSYEVEVGKDVNSIDITAIKDDATSIMQMNGSIESSPHTLTISPLQSGNTETTIVLTAENGTVITYKVVVKKESDILSTITSEQYGHKITNGFIKTVKLGITGLDMKNQLDNENEYLEIWTSDESRKVSDDETLATGMIVKLIIDGEEKDRKYIVIKGDTSGDGEIDLFDAVMILNHYLERTFLNGAYMEAALVNDDEDIDLFDSVKILNHYLERESLH